MSAATGRSIAQLRGAVLRDTSRSFYLSIRLLPAGLRDPIALAYLLARATDTIADTREISAEIRTEQLGKLAALIQNGESSADLASFNSFAALQKNPAERALIESIADCLAWLSAVEAEDRSDIRSVLALINEGQMLDVQRFADTTHVTALAGQEDLDRYTYLVAGCVGEFWTHVCFRHLPQFSSMPRETMMQLGVAYGKGLQLVNILRDAGSDLRAGRCYLPEQELRSLGVPPGELIDRPQRAEPLLRELRERAGQGMAAGVEYACAIKSHRVRIATALPALIGARTLVLLRDAGASAFTRNVKVPRAEVRRMMLTAISNLASPRSLRAMFSRLSS